MNAPLHPPSTSAAILADYHAGERQRDAEQATIATWLRAHVPTITAPEQATAWADITTTINPHRGAPTTIGILSVLEVEIPAVATLVAHLVAKRVHQEALITLHQYTMPIETAHVQLERMRQFPNQAIPDRQRDVEGELWIEVYAGNGDLITDPVKFLAAAAHATLVRIGIAPDDVTQLLSDAYAEQWLHDYVTM